MNRKSKNSSRKIAVAVDLGGTDLKTALIDSTGKILHQKIVSSESKETKEKILRRLIDSIQIELDWGKKNQVKIKGLGLGIPGILSPEKGIVYQSPHFPAWKNYPILKKLEHEFSIPMFLDNDANMAAVGEGWLGAAKNKKNFILLTLGTGMGGAIVIDRKIFHGDSGFAGEAGHLVIDRHGLQCNCGGKGCLEMSASATGIFHQLKSLNRSTDLTPLQLFGLAKKKDPLALKIFQNFGESLGIGIASIVNLLDIETIVLGGGISEAFSCFSPFALESISKYLYSTTAKKVRLVKAKLGNKAGIIGAARAMFVKTERSKKRI